MEIKPTGKSFGTGVGINIQMYVHCASQITQEENMLLHRLRYVYLLTDYFVIGYVFSSLYLRNIEI